MIKIYRWFRWLREADDIDLFDTPLPSTDGKNDAFDEFIHIQDIPPLEGNEKVKEGRGLKILTPNKLLTRFQILLAQIKAVSNSYKLKTK